MFAVLLLGYFGPSVHAVRAGAERLLKNVAIRTVAGPALYWTIPVINAINTGLNAAWYAAVYAVYLLGPALMLLARRTRTHDALVVIAAALWFWLPVEFHLLPRVDLEWPLAIDASMLLGLVTALYLFLIARPLDGIGYTFALGPRDVAIALGAVVIYALIALPIGLFTGFLSWNPRVSTRALTVTPLLIFLATALPEEFLFRGLLQNALGTWFGRLGALAVGSLIFGAAHLPDLRYVVLATLAGLAYGMVYLTTKKITASAITHAGVDWLWVMLFTRF